MASQVITPTTSSGLVKPNATVGVTEVPTPPASPVSASPRTISELISIRAKLAPSQPILGYPVEGVKYVQYTYAQLDRFATAGARVLTQTLPVRSSTADPERVVALLGSSTLDYLITALALSRLGFSVLFLSTRLSEAAYVSLLQTTKCTSVCVGTAFKKVVAGGVKAQIPHLQIEHALARDQYDLLNTDHTNEHPLPQFDASRETNKISWIIHSSGSTGLPKPIYQTHAAALRNYENNFAMTGFITLPLFHAHGISSVLRGFTSYSPIFMYNADLPLISQNLLQIMGDHTFEIFYGVPYALKLLSESAEGLQRLAAMKIVMFGGSACPDGLGDHLVENGVSLISHYGCTETGQLMTSFRPAGDKAWNYLRVHDKLAPFARFEGRGGNMYELVILNGWPSKVATNRNDGAYATKDLFEPHPSIPNAWKYAARLDDTIVLMNGEKAVPIVVEMAIRQNPLVQDVVVFGAGKDCLGVAIIASQAAADMKLKDEDIVERLWPLIEEKNRDAPAYAQITREMILLLPAGTRYPQTDKGTLIRQAFYKTFKDQIDAQYQKFEVNPSGTLVLDGTALQAYLREQILVLAPGLASEDITDDTDLFGLGIDSLQSSRLRAKITQDLELRGGVLSQNIVFEQPTISKLAATITSIRDRTDIVLALRDEDEMAALVTKYGQFPRHILVATQSKSRIAVVTGATGSLGAHVVARLVACDDITEVCCLVRARSSEDAMQRTLKSMRDRAVLHDLPLEARRKITTYPSNFGRTDLGLEPAVLERLKLGMVILIHCAWSVNFNKRLSSFEDDCIAGARNLILLCLAAQRPQPASFNFCSSVSTVARTPGTIVHESLPTLECAQGMGYAQSKLVTEHIIAKAIEQTGMSARVLRVGQIVADTKHGIWNDTEAIPLMLQAATTIGALPSLDERPRWLPVDVVAQSVAEISLSSSTKSYYNVVNPNTFHWTDDLLPALQQTGLQFSQVGQREWIKKLRASNPDPLTNPTYKLLEFFASKYDHDRPPKAGLSYETTAVTDLSPAIRDCPALPQDLVTKFIQNFLSTSWSTTTNATPRTTLLVLSGPCGSGKSTIASTLQHHLSCPSIEGDPLHDSIALTKMSSSHPLSTLDREIWLTRLKTTILDRFHAFQILSSPPPRHILLTCSALKCHHRASLRRIAGDDTLTTHFVMLEASEDELVRRVEARRGHYMKSGMVRGQVEALERVGWEERDVVPVDTEGRGCEEIAEEVLGVLGC